MSIIKPVFLATAVAALAGIGGTLSAATPPPPLVTTDVYQVNYFLGIKNQPVAGPNNAPNNGINDANLVIMDPGTNPALNMCADIYVLNPSEELEACCSCKITPDEIIVGSVLKNLLVNLLNGNTLQNGVIKIIASTTDKYGACVTGETPVPIPNLRAWLTRTDSTIPFGAGGPANVTTTQFADATLSQTEFSTLSNTCNTITKIGSGFGVCKCPTEPDHQGTTTE